jgi:transcriptional regulator with GAF, ATPase, and Fis domain
MADSAEHPKDAGENSTTLLLCGNGIGRPDPPRSAFDSTTSYGKFVIQRMNNRRPVIVEDTDSPPDDLNGVLDCADKYYKSFIAVPVTYNDHEYGMLMIDSPQKCGLTKDQQAVANLFGRFLGSGFHMVQWSPASLPRLSGARVSVNPTGGGGE